MAKRKNLQHWTRDERTWGCCKRREIVEWVFIIPDSFLWQNFSDAVDDLLHTFHHSRVLWLRPHVLLRHHHVWGLWDPWKSCGHNLPGIVLLIWFPASFLHFDLQLTITVGYVFSPLILSRLDCRPHFIVFLMIFTGSMLVIGSTTLFPSLKFLAIPALVLNGSCYGLGVGPVPFVLMSTLFPQKYKSIGLAASQLTRTLAVCVQLKVSSNANKEMHDKTLLHFRLFLSCWSILGWVEFSFFLLWPHYLE